MEIRVKTQPNAEPERVRRMLKQRYTALSIHLTEALIVPGPFGQKLTVDKVYALVWQFLVAYATDFKLYPIDLTNALGQRLGRARL